IRRAASGTTPRAMNTLKGDVDEVLVALADPMRRRVLDALSAHPQSTATALAARFPVSRKAIVKHLNVLEQAGLVEAPQWMHGIASAWDARLSAIKRLA